MIRLILLCLIIWVCVYFFKDAEILLKETIEFLGNIISTVKDILF